MAVIAKWGDLKFGVTTKRVIGMSGLQVKASSETEDKTSGTQAYVSRKKGKPAEISLTVHSDARLGCNPRNDADTFIAAAQSGKAEYFYVNGKKLVTCKVMMTDAQVSSIILSPKGKWISCEIQLTLKQCEKGGDSSGGSTGSGGGSGGGSSGSSGSGSNRISVNSSSPTTTSSSARISGAASTIAGRRTTGAANSRTGLTGAGTSSSSTRRTGTDRVTAAARTQTATATIRTNTAAANRTTAANRNRRNTTTANRVTTSGRATSGRATRMTR